MFGFLRDGDRAVAHGLRDEPGYLGPDRFPSREPAALELGGASRFAIWGSAALAGIGSLASRLGPAPHRAQEGCTEGDYDNPSESVLRYQENWLNFEIQGVAQAIQTVYDNGCHAEAAKLEEWLIADKIAIWSKCIERPRFGALYGRVDPKSDDCAGL